MAGRVIVNQGEVVRPSQLIASVGRTVTEGARGQIGLESTTLLGWSAR
jgi:hypothetical protein